MAMKMGLEPTTLSVTDLRSNQLSYSTIAIVFKENYKTPMVAEVRLELTTVGLWGRLATICYHPAIWSSVLFTRTEDLAAIFVYLTVIGCEVNGWPSRTWTYDGRINSSVFYQLNYGSIYIWAFNDFTVLVEWSELKDLNLWPNACKASALPAELNSDIKQRSEFCFKIMVV